jgi:hypothetical protein
MSDVKDMSHEDMDAWASMAYATLVTTGQEAEARVIERLGEYIRELGRRCAALEKDLRETWDYEDEHIEEVLRT